MLRGNDGTILHLTGKPHVAIVVKGEKKVAQDGRPTPITDSYVPSGANSFSVGSTAGLQVGDTIQITRPVTETWVDFMGMSDLVRDGKSETWLTGKLQTEQVVQAISGNRITVSVPLSDSYDSRYLNPPGSTVVKVTVSGLISQVGIEHLRIESPPQPIAITAPQFRALHFVDVVDSWARDLDIHDTISSLDVGAGSSRVTIQRVSHSHSVATLGPPSPGTSATTELRRCSTDAPATATMSFTSSPTVATRVPTSCSTAPFAATDTFNPTCAGPRDYWWTVARCRRAAIDLMNRGIMGSGHGWAMGWGVAWNCMAKSFVIQQPPGRDELGDWMYRNRAEPSDTRR